MCLRNYLEAMAHFLLACLLLLAVGTFGARVWAQWHDGPFRVSSLTHTMPEGDFSLVWSAGRLAAAGHAADVYDGPKLLAWRRELFGPDSSRLDWVYPPPMLALGLAFAGFPLLPGYVLWQALIWGVSVRVLRTAGLSWRVVLFGLFGTPAWTGLVLGQYAPLASSLVFAGLIRARCLPLTAGLYVATAALKPHLGILVPVAWIAQRRWAAFASAAFGTLALAAGSAVLFSPAIWPIFFRGTGISGRALLETWFRDGFPAWGASVFWAVRSFGGNLGLAYAMQAIAAAFAATMTWVAARRGPDLRTAAVATCLMSLVSPYFYAFDLVGYSIAVALLAERRGFGKLPVLLWVLPGASEALTIVTGRQALPVVVILAAYVVWRALDTCSESQVGCASDTLNASGDGVPAAHPGGISLPASRCPAIRRVLIRWR